MRKHKVANAATLDKLFGLAQHGARLSFLGRIGKVFLSAFGPARLRANRAEAGCFRLGASLSLPV